MVAITSAWRRASRVAASRADRRAPASSFSLNITPTPWFAPAYLRFTDVWDAADALRQVLERREWDAPAYRVRARVT